MENETKQCPSWCGTEMFIDDKRAAQWWEDGRGYCSEPCFWAAHMPRKSAPVPPVQEAELLTLAEAVEARLRGEDVEWTNHNGHWCKWHWGVDKEREKVSFEYIATFARAQFRLKPKPAPAVGRCRELAREWASQYSVSSTAERDAGDLCERVAKEVLGRVESRLPGDSLLRIVLADVRAWALGPSVPAQDQKPGGRP